MVKGSQQQRHARKMKRSRSGPLEQVVEDSVGEGDLVERKVKKKRSKVKVHPNTGSGSDDPVADPADSVAHSNSHMTESNTHPAVQELYTVSIALPGSIIENAQSLELKTYLAGQIARAAVVFCVNEIVVFDEQGTTGKTAIGKPFSEANVFLARLLQYLETPQYLRKSLFPMHPDLKLVGVLNPLDCPHHMRRDDPTPYRDGVVLDRPVKQGVKKGSYVDCGLRKNVQVDKVLKPRVRVTVQLKQSTKPESKHHWGKVVSPLIPREEAGLYWGYNVRLAHSFGAVFTESPFQGGYDVSIGTSERGDKVDNIEAFPKFNHLLIVFGGVKGLEYALECDSSLDVEEGSRTIRTEEAVLITLAALRPLLSKTDS